MSPSAPEPPRPTQALSPGKAVLWFFATPGLLLISFLFVWPYPPLWLVDLIAFGPPVVGAAALVIAKLAGKPLRPVATVVVPAWVFSVIYTVAGVGDVQVLDGTPFVLAALVAGFFALWPAAWLAARGVATTLQKLVATLAAAGFAAAYVYATAGLINYQADIAPTQHFTAPVVGKSSDHGRRPNRYVTLGPWGPEWGTVRHSVWPEAHNGLDNGDIACVDLHRGLLGVRWVDVAPCAPFVRPQRLP